MTSDVGRPSQRGEVLDAARALLRDGGVVSMDSVAAAAGLTKPGVMYHFPTKRALMLALIDHVVDGYEADLVQVLGGPAESAGVRDRIGAYLRWSVERPGDPSDLVALSDPRLREVMQQRWDERMRPWIAVPTDLPREERARLEAVRLIADGCWFADAAAYSPVVGDDRDALLRVGLDLLGQV